MSGKIPAGFLRAYIYLSVSFLLPFFRLDRGSKDLPHLHTVYLPSRYQRLRLLWTQP